MKEKIDAKFLCDGKWNSTLKGSGNDGFFQLDIDASGNITGKHFLPPNGDTFIKVTGKCEHTPNHHIEIDETRDGKKFKYHGKVIPKTSGEHETQDGKRSKIAGDTGEKKDDKANFEDEVWTGVRTT